MARRKNEIIFEARVEYSDKRNGKLDLHENSEVEQQIKRALTEDLPSHMETIFGVSVDVQIKSSGQGSITVFFGALVAGVSALSRYKNLYDSVILLQNQATRVIQAGLRGPGTYDVSVSAVDPSANSLEDGRTRWWRRHAPFPMDFAPPSDWGDDSRSRHSRDGFFWFLLVLCILEGAALALLVYRAVLHTYF
ncbi:MAG TPA: hypothetical protein VEU96_25615 [Bryobacteraceae bacterium]|nr:hypothetical protein [Bryobacteraceae bacterium]